MKTTYTSLLLLTALFSVTIFANSCAKADTSATKPNDQQIIGKWKINRIQLKIFVNDVVIKDSILGYAPKPENFAKFESNGGFEYKFNSAISDIGNYDFEGSSTLFSISNPKSYSWTILTLTNTLLTLVSKGPDPAFPGAYVERYQTLTR